MCSGIQLKSLPGSNCSNLVYTTITGIINNFLHYQQRAHWKPYAADLANFVLNRGQ